MKKNASVQFRLVYRCKFCVTVFTESWYHDRRLSSLRWQSGKICECVQFAPTEVWTDQSSFRGMDIAMWPLVCPKWWTKLSTTSWSSFWSHQRFDGSKFYQRLQDMQSGALNVVVIQSWRKWRRGYRKWQVFFQWEWEFVFESKRLDAGCARIQTADWWGGDTGTRGSVPLGEILGPTARITRVRSGTESCCITNPWRELPSKKGRLGNVLAFVTKGMKTAFVF